MEKSIKNHKQVAFNDPKFIQNIRKKRPGALKLDIEKMFQQSIQLTELHKHLQAQNKKLKKQYSKVQQAKNQRQKFIGTVEKIVKQKSSQFSGKALKETSWLAFKLQKKIDDLKKEIKQKDKSIHRLKMGKQNQILYRKEIELECLKQINQFAQEKILEGDENQQTFQKKDLIKNIVWMEDFLCNEQLSLQKLQCELEAEQRYSKNLMKKLAMKKTELKKLKQVIREYNKTQQNYHLQKMRKQEKITGNKDYLSELVKQRDQQLQKMEQLRKKQAQIIQQEQSEIIRLQQKLQQIKNLYEKNQRNISQKRETVIKSIPSIRKQQWVKRVTYEEVSTIARNVNLTLSLRKISQNKWIQLFFADGAQQYSIGEVIQKLQKYPFKWENQQECKLLARYLVQDQDPGLMLEDLQTSQASPIIKSILTKLLGDIKVYSQTQAQSLTQKVGQYLHKFSSLVEQAIQLKDGHATFLGEEKIRQGFELAILQLTNEEIDFAILYLFSWSHRVDKMELKNLGKMKQKGIKWIE